IRIASVIAYNGRGEEPRITHRTKRMPRSQNATVADAATACRLVLEECCAHRGVEYLLHVLLGHCRALHACEDGHARRLGQVLSVLRCNKLLREEENQLELPVKKLESVQG